MPDFIPGQELSANPFGLNEESPRTGYYKKDVAVLRGLQ